MVIENTEPYFEGLVEKVLAGGDGLVRSAQGVVLIPFTLPGEKVRYTLEKKQSKGVLRAKVLEILEANPQRRTAPCPVYEQCGGCNLMHAQASLQREIKKAIFLDVFNRQGGEAAKTYWDVFQDAEFFQGDEWAYRSRMRFHRSPEGFPGLKALRSSRILTLTTCEVAHRQINNWLASRPHLDLKKTVAKPSKYGKPRQEKRQTKDNRDSYLEDEDSSEYPVFASEEKLFLAQDTRTITLQGKKFRFSPESFFQSNLAMLDTLLLWWQDQLANSGITFNSALDLYGGIGLFSAFMPPSVKKITLVEINAQACADARENFKNDDRLEIYSGSVETWLTKKISFTPDLLLVDPPRAGLSKELIGILPRLKPRLLSYVSCDPVTLARDTALLIAAGFIPQKAAVFDFYPQTWHLESVIIFKGPVN